MSEESPFSDQCEALGRLYTQAAATGMPFQRLVHGRWCSVEGNQSPQIGSDISKWRVKPKDGVDYWWLSPGIPPSQDQKDAIEWQKDGREVMRVKVVVDGKEEEYP